MIDGGHTRAVATRARLSYTPELVERLALSSVQDGERLHRALYYDCPRYAGKTKLPVSNEPFEFDGTDKWLKLLARKDLFAVRRGVLKFGGWKPRNVPVDHSRPLHDEDFEADFEQKGVDMRIGLDIATFASTKAVDRILLVSGDTDCIPAMKFGRIAGLQIAIASLPKKAPSSELQWHADFVRELEWPEGAKKRRSSA